MGSNVSGRRDFLGKMTALVAGLPALTAVSGPRRADAAAADSGTKIEEAGAEAQDPKVFRPALFWRQLWLVDAATGRAAGSASYLRIEPKHGVIEVGHIYFSPRLAQTRACERTT